MPRTINSPCGLKKNKTVYFRLEPTFYEKLLTLCQRKGFSSLAAFMRFHVLNFLLDMEKDKEERTKHPDV